ncbi:deaminated glutathione amidase-like [Actinia tenebrosa]|uniref:Deaminated glutathione amidase-like n=1 Tax=Actinia tenebrosa TaxID=6105 RepID=A0A6P8I0L1_ACTTE|nr:deaminated glutathione amidase-like [Actinia tenebrosa]
MLQSFTFINNFRILKRSHNLFKRISPAYNFHLNQIRTIFYTNSKESSSRKNLCLGKKQLLGREMASDGKYLDAHIIAVCQMTSKNDVHANFRTCKDLIERAKARRAKMVFLPEAYDYLGETKQESLAMAQSIKGPRMKEMCQLAKENDIWLSLGGFHNKSTDDENRISNTHVIVDNNGEIVSTYDKAHLFDVDIKDGPKLKESANCIPGNEIVPPVTTPVGKVGMAICYDLRFPEMALSLAKQGADILTFPSAFTFTTGTAHWEVLLRSRAIETQCYVVAAAQIGQTTSKRKCYGHAMVVDPWGTVIAQCHEETGLCVAEIHHQYIKQVREQMPVWSHRRTDLYGDLKPNL